MNITSKDTSKVFESLTSVVVVIVLMAGTVMGWVYLTPSKEAKTKEPAAVSACANSKDAVMRAMCAE